jgi:hypothetical protein
MKTRVLSFGRLPKRFAVPADPRWLHVLLPAGVIGTYLLFRNGRVFYVGRSDHCLRTRLTDHSLLREASHVCWEACKSPEQAFRLEAYWYDALKPAGGLLNVVHPARPEGDLRTCPFCDLRGVSVRAALPFGGTRFPDCAIN